VCRWSVGICRPIFVGDFLMTYKAELMCTADVNRALKRISHEILERNGGCDNIYIIGVMRRGVPLAERIAENIAQIEGKAVSVGSVDVTPHRDDLNQKQKKPVITFSKIDEDITNKKVILVDDVLYTGRTARAALEAILEFGRPKSVQLAVLVDRGHRELPIRGDYVGKNIPTSRSERISVTVPPFEEELSVKLYTE